MINSWLNYTYVRTLSCFVGLTSQHLQYKFHEFCHQKNNNPVTVQQITDCRIFLAYYAFVSVAQDEVR